MTANYFLFRHGAFVHTIVVAATKTTHRQLLRQMTKIYVTPSSSTLPGFHDASEDRGGGGVRKNAGCPSINALGRKRELERIAMENMHLVRGDKGGGDSQSALALKSPSRTEVGFILNPYPFVRVS